MPFVFLPDIAFSLLGTAALPHEDGVDCVPDYHFAVFDSYPASTDAIGKMFVE